MSKKSDEKYSPQKALHQHPTLSPLLSKEHTKEGKGENMKIVLYQIEKRYSEVNHISCRVDTLTL